MIFDDEFERLYRRYPNHEGKKRGMMKLKNTITSELLLHKFAHSMDNYLKLCEAKGRIQGGFVKQWSTFCNNWEDYLDSGLLEETKSTNLTQLEKIAKGQL